MLIWLKEEASKLFRKYDQEQLENCLFLMYFAEVCEKKFLIWLEFM